MSSAGSLCYRTTYCTLHHVVWCRPWYFRDPPPLQESVSNSSSYSPLISPIILPPPDSSTTVAHLQCLVSIHLKSEAPVNPAKIMWTSNGDIRIRDYFRRGSRTILEEEIYWSHCSLCAQPISTHARLRVQHWHHRTILCIGTFFHDAFASFSVNLLSSKGVCSPRENRKCNIRLAVLPLGK